MMAEEFEVGGSGNVNNFTPYTGLATVMVCRVNPSNDDYLAITGKPCPFDLKYDKTEKDGVKTQILKFLVYEPSHNVYSFLDIFLTNADITNKAGDLFKFMDVKGNISYFLNDVNNMSEKVKHFVKEGAVKVKRGEDSLTLFLQRLIGYRSDDKGSNWREDIKKGGFDTKSLFNNETKGLNKYLTTVADRGWTVTVLFTVRVKDGKIYQSIENNPDLFWGNQGFVIANGVYLDLKSKVESQAAAGYTLVKNYFTYKFRPFVLEECINYVSTDPVTTAADINGATPIGNAPNDEFGALDDEPDPFLSPVPNDLNAPNNIDEWTD